MILLVAGCGARLGPAVPVSLSPEAEALAGRRAAPRLESEYGGILRDPAAEARMAAAGKRLSQGVPGWPACRHFSLLASDQINAFSLPGGLIYVTRGLYLRIGPDDGLLAAVIAHEMSHVLARDSLKPACDSAEDALQREVDADAGAVLLLRNAGYVSEELEQLLALTADVQPAGWSASRRARLPQ